MIYNEFAQVYDKLMYDFPYKENSEFLFNILGDRKIKVLEMAAGFRVIIVIEANSYVNIRSSRLLPKFKTQKINSWCAA